MALPTLQRKLFENDGYGPKIKDERLSTDITVKDWDASYDYPANVLVKAGGDIYKSVAASGPSTPAGAQDPAADSGTYWTAVPSNDANVVHKTGTEAVYGTKTFHDNLDVFGVYEDTTTIALHLENINVGETPSVKSYIRFIACDKSGSLAGHRFGAFQTSVDTDGTVETSLGAYSNSSPQNDASLILSSYPNGTAYTSLPGEVRSSAGTERLVLLGGNSAAYTSGAKINVYSVAHSDTTLSGGVVIQTGGATGTQHKYLNIYKNGTLTWDGNPIQTTSDERLKTPLSNVPDAVLDAWEAVDWGQFQFLEAVAEKGEAARLHLGLIAQRVRAVFGERGLDACEYGILCHEERPATDGEPAVDLWMVRYTEALAMEAACQRRRAGRAEVRIASLEARLAALEAKLNG